MTIIAVGFLEPSGNADLYHQQVQQLAESWACACPNRCVLRRFRCDFQGTSGRCSRPWLQSGRTSRQVICSVLLESQREEADIAEQSTSWAVWRRFPSLDLPSAIRQKCLRAVLLTHRTKDFSRKLLERPKPKAALPALQQLPPVRQQRGAFNKLKSV